MRKIVWTMMLLVCLGVLSVDAVKMGYGWYVYRLVMLPMFVARSMF